MTKIFDSHIHSEFSHDSTAKLSDIFRAASEKGLCGITITDHCDIHKVKSPADFENIKNSAESTQGNFPLKVLAGCELGDGFTDTAMAKLALSSADFDFVLCSCHTYATMRTVVEDFKSGDFDFFNTAEVGVLKEFTAKYYDNLIFCAKNLEYDSLAHLTFPFRYINGRAGNYEILPKDYRQQIDTLLEIAVSRQKAIEINTSGVKAAWGELMPNKAILKRYFDMGGRLITIGSDAHVPEKICSGIDEALEALKAIGFKEYYYYEKRKPTAVNID